ncbi:MAG: hypothetical protein HY920_08660 [Elusimicrobia bacterium]|nr:hypothetical protein [Elusimicrobiota bacterium]
MKEILYQAYPAEHDRLDRFFAEVDKLVAATGSFMTKFSLWAKLTAGLRIPLSSEIILKYRKNK